MVLIVTPREGLNTEATNGEGVTEPEVIRREGLGPEVKLSVCESLLLKNLPREGLDKVLTASDIMPSEKLTETEVPPGEGLTEKELVRDSQRPRSHPERG